MPRIINAAADGNSALADALKSFGEGAFGNEAKNEVERQTARKLGRENTGQEGFAAALRNNDIGGMRESGILSGRPVRDIADANLLSSSSTAKNIDDPNLALAQIGAHEPIASTAVGQGRQLANQAGIERMREDANQFVPTTVGMTPDGQAIHGAMNKRSGGAQAFNLPGSTTNEPPPATEGEAAQVQGMLEGRIPPPSLSRAGSPAVRRLLDLAARQEPGFDFTKWTARNGGAKAFAAGGRYGETTRAIDQAMMHTSELTEKSDALPTQERVLGMEIPPLTHLVNSARINVLGGNAGATAGNNFRINANAVANEVAKLYRATGMSVKDIEEWRGALHENMTKEEKQGAIKTMMGLYRDGVTALEDLRSRTMQTATPLPSLMSPETQGRFDATMNWANGVPKAAPGAAPQGQPGAPAGGRPPPPLLGGGSAQAAPAAPQGGPAPNDVAYLRAHPDKAAAFDKRFGQGAARQVLGGR